MGGNGQETKLGREGVLTENTVPVRTYKVKLKYFFF